MSRIHVVALRASLTNPFPHPKRSTYQSERKNKRAIPGESPALDKVAPYQFSMASEPLVGAMLRTLVASRPAGRFLELGTGTGIATAWLLEGMDEHSKLISVDNDAGVQAVAKDSPPHCEVALTRECSSRLL